ncbi:keratin-associated protein 5-1-like [Plodia interpunctella]|uniref:keratin-associated protein 5-1-like n=1 Tax=Plodia interpunctella TaxID=58824 RepID=UPI002367F8C6|nr:keratin-associated protein 5-1-like [Plodia interpunctella]
MASTHLFLLLIGVIFQTNAAVLKKNVILSSVPVPFKNLPLPFDLPLLPSCSIPEIVTPVEVPVCSNIPTCNCPKPVIEIPTYYSPTVPVPSCGSCGSFSTSVELALSGSGIPSCSSSTPVCGCSTPVCGCSTPVCGCSTPVCGCSTPVCGCSKVDVPAYYYSPPVEVCGGCNDALCACGAYVSPVSYAPTCGCAQAVTQCGCAPTLPPYPPALGCAKYLRQVVIQPPFL